MHRVFANMKKSLLALGLLFSALYGADGVDHQHLYTIGTVCARHRSTLGSVVSGRVDEVLVDVGDRVEKGQPLLRLDTQLFTIALAEAEAVLQSSNVELEDACRNYERMKKLFEQPTGPTPVISQKRLEDAQARYHQAQAGKARAEEVYRRAQQQLQETTVVAPYSGVITKRHVHAGEAVNATPTTKLLEMVSVEAPYVEFSIPQLQVAHVRVGSVVTLRVDGKPNRELSAPIELMYPDVDEKTRTTKCRATLPTGELQPGALVRVILSLKENGCAAL
jgi:membrane fusion protein, multidrug efflux system